MMEEDWEEEEERKMAYQREYMLRKERYERGSGREKHERPSVMHRMEKLAHAYRRGKISRQEYEMQKEMFREYMMRRRRYYDDFGMMMWEEMFFKDARDSSSSSDEEDRTEERFLKLEAERRKWHVDLPVNKWQQVAATKKMVGDGIILGNDYNVDRIVGMSKDLREPVFLTKMAYYAVKMGTASCLKSLIKYGAWVNQPTTLEDEKYTPLHLACKNNDKECVEVLVFSKAKADKLDIDGHTCLLLAMHSGCEEAIIKLVLRRTKSPFLTQVNKRGENLLHHCGPFFKKVKEGKEPKKRDNVAAYELILKTAKEKGELQQLLEMRDNERGYTPIFDAVLANSPAKVKLLADYGAKVDVVTTGTGIKRETPVHIAATKGYHECLKNLLDAGASANVRNEDGDTPIICAFKNYSNLTIFYTTQALFEHGARVHENFMTLFGKQSTIFHHAIRYRHEALVGVFLEYGASPFVAEDGGVRPIDIRDYEPIHERIYSEARRLRSLSEICKWKIRESFESGGSLLRAADKLPIPQHLKDFIKEKGHEKPHFKFTEEAAMDEDGAVASSGGATAATSDEKMDTSSPIDQDPLGID